MQRGRPPKSEIREKITAILDQLQFSYGYEIYKHYKSLFNDATARVIYYHLKKGAEIGEFVEVNVKRVMGNYSWGDETERVYYALGPFAKTNQDLFKKAINSNLKKRKIDYEWDKEISKKISELKEEVKKAGSRDKQRLMNKCNKLLEWCKTKTKSNNHKQEINAIMSFLK